MKISDQHWRFLLIEQGAAPTLFNLLLNGLIAWFLFRSVESLSLWGEPSVGIDLLVTAFLLPFLTCVIASAVAVRQVRSGKIPPLPSEYRSLLAGWFRRSSLVGGIFFGIAGVIFAATPVILALDLAQAQAFSVSSFVIFKAVWAALLAMLVSPLIGCWALVNASLKHST